MLLVPQMIGVPVYTLPFPQDSADERKASHWEWCSIDDITECLNNRRGRRDIGRMHIFGNFAALSGFCGPEILVSYVEIDPQQTSYRVQLHKSHNPKKPRIALHSDCRYFIPEGWTRRILEFEIADCDGVELEFDKPNPHPLIHGLGKSGERLRVLPAGFTVNLGHPENADHIDHRDRR